MEHGSEIVPHVNTKCIVLTLLIAAGYWFLPPRNKWVLVSLLYYPYLVLAWYDHLYACQSTLGPSYLHTFYAWFKPKNSKQLLLYAKMNDKYKRRIFLTDIAVLVVIILLIPSFLKWNPT